MAKVKVRPSVSSIVCSLAPSFARLVLPGSGEIPKADKRWVDSSQRQGRREGGRRRDGEAEGRGLK